MSAATGTPMRHSAPSPMSTALAANARAFLALGMISGVINILMLTGSVFMIQVYDRVLASRSLPTLIALSAMAGAAYLLQGALDTIRSRALTLIGERIDARIGPQAYAAAMDARLQRGGSGHETLQPFRDLDAVRGFLSGPGCVAIFDLPWLPIYILACFLLHPWLGYASASAAMLLMAITVLTDLRGAGPARRAMEAQSRRNALADSAQRGAEVIHAMGMLPAFARHWNEAHTHHLAAQRRSSFIIGGLSSLVRMSRLMVQSAMLALGAWLAISGEISAGAIIAVSILASRAIAPVDQAIANWRSFTAARQGYKRLREFLIHTGGRPAAFDLPPPSATLDVSGLFIAPPGAAKPTLRNVSFSLKAGQALGIIGASASGKSTLARALVGVWPARAGKVTLDGADIRQWDASVLGRHFGYLPQEFSLFEGTIAENISRFDHEANAAAVIAAAHAAGFHRHLLNLPDGYDTRIGSGGAELSAGQRQRLALARALYRDPFLVVLDEPNSNLDAEGEDALHGAINAIRSRGGIAIVIAHRRSVLAAVDQVMVMRNGECVAFGARDAVLGDRALQPTPPLRAIQATGS